MLVFSHLAASEASRSKYQHVVLSGHLELQEFRTYPEPIGLATFSAGIGGGNMDCPLKWFITFLAPSSK